MRFGNADPVMPRPDPVSNGGGCDPLQEKQYLRDGIGTDLGRSEMANTTALLTQYIGYICKQAGLELIPDEPAASCSDRGFTPRATGCSSSRPA